MNDQETKQNRLNDMARREADIWTALIGAHGSPSIQKYALMPRMYAFIRAIVNMDHVNPDREVILVHGYAKNGAGQKLRNFIDFIDGRMSIGEAIIIRDALQADSKAA